MTETVRRFYQNRFTEIQESYPNKNVGGMTQMVNTKKPVVKTAVTGVTISADNVNETPDKAVS